MGLARCAVCAAAARTVEVGRDTKAHLHTCAWTYTRTHAHARAHVRMTMHVHAPAAARGEGIRDSTVALPECDARVHST